MELVKNKLIIIGGPTGSGKTKLAIQIAQKFKCQILSADSRQCYKELNIGVAKPTEEELRVSPHFFINSHSIFESVNAGTYERFAIKTLENIFAEKNIALCVGGTGLYINAITYGIDEMPEINLEIEQDIIKKYKENGKNWLQKEIEINDKLFFETGEIENPARILRALIFKKSTGKSITEFKKQIKKNRNFDIHYYCIEMDREILYNNINQRVDVMMQDGLLNEVQNLLPYANLKSLQTVGYTELFRYLNNEINLDKAVELIKQNTRRYAKRQLTWFRNDGRCIFKSPQEILNDMDKL